MATDWSKTAVPADLTGLSEEDIAGLKAYYEEQYKAKSTDYVTTKKAELEARRRRLQARLDAVQAEIDAL